MGWFELGKTKRSKFGKFVENRLGMTHQEFADMCGVSRATISRLCSSDGFKPNMGTASKIARAVRRELGMEFSTEDFW